MEETLIKKNTFSKDGWMFKHLDKDNVENNELQQLKELLILLSFMINIRGLDLPDIGHTYF